MKKTFFGLMMAALCGWLSFKCIDMAVCVMERLYIIIAALFAAGVVGSITYIFDGTHFAERIANFFREEDEL